MNLHINGIEIDQVALTVEAIVDKKYLGKTFDEIPRMGKSIRVTLELESRIRRRLFRRQPAVLVLERAPSDPQLAVKFGPGMTVRLGRRSYRVYRRDMKRNKVFMREVQQ